MYDRVTNNHPFETFILNNQIHDAGTLLSAQRFFCTRVEFAVVIASSALKTIFDVVKSD
jgi:hypothetical protein